MKGYTEHYEVSPLRHRLSVYALTITALLAFPAWVVLTTLLNRWRFGA